MGKSRKCNLYKQTTMLLYCGLLSLPILAQQRSKEDVSHIVMEFQKQHPKAAKHGFQLKATSSQIFPEKTALTTVADTAFYIYASQDSGFVIVSNDERMPRVLGYSEQSNFDVDNIPPNVKYWLSCYVDNYLSLDQGQTENRTLHLDVKETGVLPLLDKIQWGQDSPYNSKCPSYRGARCVTGCVATAMAQVMKYYSYPLRGKGVKDYRTDTHKFHIKENFSDIEFAWAHMLDGYEGTYTDEQANAVATLMYACGVAAEMDYGTEASGTTQYNLLLGYINHFQYDKDAALMIRDYCMADDWHRLLLKELNEARPVNYAGTSKSDGGHSFVIDGYKVSQNSDYPDYHINWGWKGNYDGYYQLASLRPKENSQYAVQAGFSDTQQMIVGIQPDDGQTDGMSYLCSTNLRVSSTSVKSGGKVKVYTSECYNLAYQDFSGEIEVVLVDMNDNIYVMGQKTITTIPSFEGISNFNVGITIPTDFEDGTYAVRLRSRKNGSEQWSMVCSTSVPTLSVSEEGSEVIDDEVKVYLVCSEAELLDEENGHLVSLNLYEVMCLQETPFVGTLRMVLADKNGNYLTAFGDSVQPGEMGYNDMLEKHIHLSGMFTDVWSDGKYRLYVGVKQITNANYSYLKHYDWMVLGSEPSDLYYDVQIKDGIAVINGHTYQMMPTSIPSIFSMQKKDFLYGTYTLTGIPVTKEVMHSHPGIYIQNGKKVIIH